MSTIAIMPMDQPEELTLLLPNPSHINLAFTSTTNCAQASELFDSKRLTPHDPFIFPIVQYPKRFLSDGEELEQRMQLKQCGLSEQEINKEISFCKSGGTVVSAFPNKLFKRSKRDGEIILGDFKLGEGFIAWQKKCEQNFKKNPHIIGGPNTHLELVALEIVTVNGDHAHNSPYVEKTVYRPSTVHLNESTN